MSNPDLVLIPSKDWHYLVNPYSVYLLDRSPDFALAYNERLQLYAVVRPHMDKIVLYCFLRDLDDNLKSLLE